MKRFCLFLIFLQIFFAAPPLLAYTNPGNPTGHVNDFAHVLSNEQLQNLETKLTTFQSQTQHQIAVVTIPSLQGDTIENFAVKLFEDWGIGQQQADNGVLLLIATEDREVRIEVGYGLEGDLTDAQSYWIIQNQIIPEFKQNNYYAGIDNGLTQIISAIQGHVIPSSEPSSPTDSNFFMWGLILAGYILSWLAGILARSKSWYAGGIIGSIAGILLTLFYLGTTIGIPITIGLALFGFLFDYIVSRTYQQGIHTNTPLPWWTGGNVGRSSSGGFGGFGGGRSGGGGASGRW